jgi:DNA modification methylase
MFCQSGKQNRTKHAKEKEEVELVQLQDGLRQEARRYRSMELVTFHEFKTFATRKRMVTIENQQVKIGNEWKISDFGPPKDYVPETSTVWSFPSRGDWATHLGNYRGNWSPYIPRNLILKYTDPYEMVLDQMAGSGTTLVECKLLGRNAIGVDINRDAMMIALDRLNFCKPMNMRGAKETMIRTYVGDARNLNLIENDSVDLVATHPPYAGIINYTNTRVEGDLSSEKLEGYLKNMRVVAEEAFRVLKHDKCCAVLIGDTRKHLHYVPISARVLEVFLDAGFLLKEDIIKLQWKTKTTREKWRGRKYEFYKIAHEHLYVFRKPAKGEKLSPLKYSLKWHENSSIDRVVS